MVSTAALIRYDEIDPEWLTRILTNAGVLSHGRVMAVEWEAWRRVTLRFLPFQGGL
jgi:hypothetical protein